MPRSGRSAFTRVELLFAIAIASIVAGLVGCAVVKVREAAARANCQCALKAISLAAHNYDSTYSRLPPGLVGAPPDQSPNSANFPNHGPLTFLLPFIEYEALYKQFVRYDGGPPVAGGMLFVNDPQSPKFWPDNDDKQLGHPDAPWWKNATNFRLAQTKIRKLICPSDNPYANTQFTSVCTIVGQNEFVNMLVPVNQGGATLGRTNYIASAGAFGYTADPFYQKYIGPFTSRSSAKIAEIKDGTSNTFAFGETLGGESHGERIRAMSWMGAGALPTAFGVPQKSFAWNFSSRHSGVVQFGMMDGSCQRIRILDQDGRTPAYFTAAWYNLQRIGGMADGEAIDYSTLDF